LEYSAKAIEEYWNEFGREECGIDERELLMLRRQEAERGDEMEVDDVEGEVDNATVAESAEMCDE
ncbi:MAG: hypothetical protein Q9188_004543, partial [Gyalolechia gomerana]